MSSLALVGIFSATVCLIAAFARDRSSILWFLITAGSCMIFEIPIRFVVLATQPGLLAEAGMSMSLSFVIYAMISGVLVLILFGLPKGKANERKKACPRCAEKVLADAKVCRFCGHDFASPTVAAADPRSP